MVTSQLKHQRKKIKAVIKWLTVHQVCYNVYLRYVAKTNINCVLFIHNQTIHIYEQSLQLATRTYMYLLYVANFHTCIWPVSQFYHNNVKNVYSETGVFVNSLHLAFEKYPSDTPVWNGCNITRYTLYVYHNGYCTQLIWVWFEHQVTYFIHRTLSYALLIRSCTYQPVLSHVCTYQGPLCRMKHPWKPNIRHKEWWVLLWH